jgi:small subunit ribosomal protein S7
MSRKHRAQVREVLPDPRFNDMVVTKFINALMIGGKKSIAEKIFYGALDQAESKAGEEGIKIFKKAMSNVKPSVEVKSRRIGGATYQVPTEVRAVRKQSLAIRWLRDNALSRNGRTMVDKLCDELVDAANNRGELLRRKRMFIKWLRLTKHSLTLSGNCLKIYNIEKERFYAPFF